MITVHGANTTYDQLKTTELVRPKTVGKYWQGIQHGYLVDVIQDEVRSRGWKVEEAQYALTKDGFDLAAAFLLKTPTIKVPEGQTLSLGVLTSNKMTRALKMVVGTQVTVCHNGMATGEVVLAKKHTKHLDLFDEVAEGIDRYAIKAKAITDVVEGLRHADLKSEDAEHILMEAGRQGLMPWSRIGDVDHEYRNPTFSDHGKNTSWALLNAFTYVVKRNPVQSQMDQMIKFRELLPVVDIAA